MKTDSKGFLIADAPLDTASLASGIDAVHSDTSAILSLLKSGSRASLMRQQRVSSPARAALAGPSAGVTAAAASAVRSALAKSRARDAGGRFLPGASATSPPGQLTDVAKAVDSMTRKQASDRAAEKRAESAAAARGDQKRDASGRFVGSGGGSGGGRRSGGDGFGLLSRLKSLTGFGSKIGLPDVGDFDKVDPSVEAAKEVHKLVGTPLAAVGKLTKAGVTRAFGGGANTAVSWYRKIFNVLKSSKDQQGEFGLVQTRTLKEIDNKTGGEKGSGGGLLGSIGGALSGLLGKGGGLLGKGGGLLSSVLGGAMKIGKFGLKRLPLLGALFAGGSALASIMGGDDPNKTAQENREDRFKGAGSGIGALVGGAVGLIGGPVGAMIGGVVGDKVGELVGGWLATLDWTKIGAQITGAWDDTVGFFKDSWKTVTDKLEGVAKTVGDAWTAIVSGAKAFLKDKFGVDIDALLGKAKDVVAPAVEATKKAAAPVIDAAKKGVDAAADAGKAAVDYGKERVTKMAAPIATAAGNALDWGKGLFGKGSKGNKLALMSAADKAGITDPKERAMFMAQMDTESGGFRSLEENLNYKPATLRKVFGKYFKSDDEAKAAAAGGPEAIANKVYGGRMGNTEAGDGYKYRGRGFVQLTGKANYKAAGEALGIDLVNNPDLAADPAVAAQLATWYWQSKSGLSEAARAGDVKTVTRKLNGGLNGLDVRDEKYDKYLAQGSATPSLGTGTAVAQAAPPPIATTAAAAAPKPPAIPVAAVPAAPAAPPAQQASIPVPVNSDKPLEVRVADDRAVGQDLGNRRLAQIATGGLSG
ncbi:glycoside hydrolase family 19 protein [Paraburkholderia sp. C35]|uniref:glycoside hydrolase family 19 protein n=1 Tax=Paraburkholderia sp. C35 TaxID=2126993 RepID=UPI0019504D9C|nr:glycoside hydrolase family 19 protein [Paraburkholderia sp. C35]